jgi:hypothetical protein
VVHDSIRQRQLEAGVPSRVAAALRLFTWQNDDILWAALFVMAVMLRDSSTIHKVGGPPAALLVPASACTAAGRTCLGSSPSQRSRLVTDPPLVARRWRPSTSRASGCWSC